MPKVNLSDIKVGERFREKFEGIEELMESIEKHGLLHPIVIDNELNLIAGERRLRAHQQLGREFIEVKYLSDVSDLEKKEIELEENIMRRQFTWPEEVNAKAQLHKLKQTLAQQKGEKWGTRQTAQALGEAHGTSAMDIQLAKGLKAFPELLTEKSKTTAYKKMKSMQEAIINAELAKRMQEQGIISNPDILNGDCVELMGDMADNSIDLILTDPPYGINIGNAKTFGRESSQKTYEDGDFETFDLLDKAIAQFYRVLKDNRHILLFCGIDKFPVIKQLLEKHKFTCHHIPLIWDKGSGSYASQGVTFTHCYEAAVHAWKGKRKLNSTPTDILRYKRVPSNKKIHPSEKPAEMMRDLISILSQPGEVILDPFAGSGVVVEAAKDTMRQCKAIELDPAYYKNIITRISKNA